MKIHVKKKAYRLACKKNAKAGMINTESGNWVNRSSVKDSSMKRDYYPQSGK